jgi:predicted dehydrogenase
MATPTKCLRVGVVGAGEVAQVVHLPTLALLNHLYTTTAICDLSLEVSALMGTLEISNYSGR